MNKEHKFDWVEGRLWRCVMCGLDRWKIPIIGLWRPWKGSCQG